MSKRWLLILMTVSYGALTACATTSELDASNQQMQHLSEQVTALQAEWNMMKDGYDPDYQLTLVENITQLKRNMSTAKDASDRAQAHAKESERHTLSAKYHMNEIQKQSKTLKQYDIEHHVKQEMLDLASRVRNDIRYLQSRTGDNQSTLQSLKHDVRELHYQLMRLDRKPK